MHRNTRKGLVSNYGPDITLFQDNAPIYAANPKKTWLKISQIDTTEWRPHTPHLNPIEPARVVLT